MEDRELVRQVQNGNKEALGMIIEKYYDHIYRFCRFYTGMETEAYDITQEVFLKFIRYADAYRHKNLKGYLLTIARNLCLDFFRKKREVLGLENAPEEGEEDKGIGKVEDEMFLEEILGKLPVQQREVVLLRLYEERKFCEIAVMLGCNTATVKSRYKLGIASIRREMEKSYGKKRKGD